MVDRDKRRRERPDSQLRDVVREDREKVKGNRKRVEKRILKQFSHMGVNEGYS